MKQYIKKFTIFTLLLLVGGIANEVWAATVTYHILTLPIEPSTRYDYHMKSAITGYRLEAVKIVVDNQTVVGLPPHYQSPLATGFKYYKPDGVTVVDGSAIDLYDNGPAKGIRYRVKGEDTPANATDDAKPVAEGSVPYANTAEYYVVYTYNESNTIAKLDGSVNYNIGVKGKGFLSLNRGRNNRPAVIPTGKVDPEMLASPDFSYVDAPGNNIGTYWNDGNNKNSRDSTESKFFFGFKFEGKDPYHIVVRTSYNRDYTYIEKNEGTSNFVYKWYKGAALMSAGAGNKANAYITSDDHVQYTTSWVDGNPNPTDLSEGYVSKTGYFHGNKNIWNTVALLNNTSNTGYVFMGTRTVDSNGATPTPSDNKYNYLTFNGYNNLNYLTITGADATKSHTVDGIYPLKKVTFKIVTPFYAAEQTSAHIVSAATDWVSQYTVENDVIESKYLPSSLQRKYCTFTGKFYKDAACTQEITKFSDATDDPTEGYQVYVGYRVDSDIPFKAITPAATYTASTWAGATWYELTDDGSTQTDGLKLKYDVDGAPNKYFKNNGADNAYDKYSEFAFIGDPYELRVVLRNNTADNTVQYVGATGTPPSTGTALTVSTTASEGYKWELPNDATAGSFLLRKYKDEGNWYWDAGHPSPVAISYSTKAHTYNVATANAQTVTFNVSDLGYTEGDYILVTAGGTDASQVTVSSEKFHVQSGGTASFTAAIKGRGDSDKHFTLSIQKYHSDNSTDGAVSVITVNQENTTYTSNTVQYSTENSTRVKVMDLPTRSFTYNIVDKSGRIAVKASATQTILSPLSLASIPSIIVSPFLYGETVTFYSSYSGGGRGNLSSEITALPEGNAATSTNIYVKYTTAALNAKPINLSEDQELNVKLNGQYIYYDKEANVLKTKADPTSAELNSSEYLWKLRNRDPYAMLIDNMGAREDLVVNDQSESVTVYDDSGTGTSDTRQVGAWVWLNNVALPATSAGIDLKFTTTRADAQRFIAKSSLQQAVYEVMVADGGSVDASTTYYDIACPEANTVKIYNNTTYAHGHDVLRFVLNQNVVYTYHLIDKAKHELLTATSKTPDLALPAEYQSPLVATYHFYDEDNITKSEGVYTVKTPATELTSLSGLLATATEPAESTADTYANADANHKHEDALSTDDIKEKAKKLTVTGNHYFKIGENYFVVNVTKACYYDVYVTYDVNDIVTFNTGSYMLKFLEPFADGYHLEDGNDKLTATQIQAVYPYCNGDGNLNIYGEEMQKEQFNGGSSTRPRWIWRFDSENKDPYHVAIRSRNTISYNNVSNPTYLTTYVVHFNQDASENTKHVVTGGTMPGVASVNPTEYMVLGSVGKYKLLTTNTIDDGETNVRRSVTSFEQYWKTYNMIKLHVLGISESTNAYSDDESTWVVPEEQRSTLNTRLGVLGVGSGNWHSYDAYANATRWNGFNDKTNGEGKKVVEKLEHWYQTFEMGTGTFDIESADVPPVLVLLDRHGWEIMRRPLPTKNYPKGEELKALKVYDSPLVDRYYFYSNATKASGCHKYTLRLNDNQTERDQIKVNGEHYSSTSLADLPPITATGVKSGGAFNDQFVIYTVKEEYEKNYTYSLNKETSPYSESGTSQPYLMLQNGRFYKIETNEKRSYLSKPIVEHSTTANGNVYDLIVSPRNNTVNIIDGSGNFIGNNFWYVKPNLNIDEEMGIPWIQVTGETTVDAAKNKLREEYEKKTGFDPYNIQLQLVNKNDGTSDGRYLTTHMTSTTLNDGIMVGEYEYALTANDADDVDTQAKKLKATGKYYFKLKDESYCLVNVTVAYDGLTDATYSKESGSYATQWSNTLNKSIMITLEAECTTPISSEGYDHTTMQITNQTFMAVSDANDNLQLMPRFDHTKRVDLEGTNPWETKLKDPVDHAKASADNNSSMGPQTTFFVNPKRFHYHIIDNNGREALRYKRGADFYPAITAHFKSPLAKDFTYYKGLAEGSIENSTVEEWGPATGNFKRTLTKESMLADAAKLLPTQGTYYYRIGTRGEFTYKKVTVAEDKGLLDKQITGSFAEANIEGVDCDVYVRYSYDDDTDHDADKILEGKWFTAKLANKDLQADGKVMTFTKTVADETAYASAKEALSSDGVYYFKRTDTNPYTYTKVTRSGGVITDDVGSSESEWTNAQGLGVNLYTGENSLTATDGTDLAAQANKLTETGDYYFRVGTDSYTYYKVTVTTAYDGETDAAHTDDLDDGSKGYATKWSNSKPSVVDTDAKKWQWKFLAAPTDPSSDYYVEPDPYAVQLFNREANYTTNPSEEPSPMAVGIKVPNETTGADRFALLSHPSGGYAFVVAKTYSDYDYPFLNGASMTTSVAATTTTEAGFNYKTGAITAGAQVVLDDDVTHNYTYNVITNEKIVNAVNQGNKLAITATQTHGEAVSHSFAPYLPESAQTRLLNMDDYLYYGFASVSGGTYSVTEQTKLYTLYGLYDDVVYVRYKAFNSDNTPYFAPNMKGTSGGHVARHADSNDVPINISGKLPYNIIWYNDNMMCSEGSTVSDGGSKDLTGNSDYTWYFEGDDPYVLHIKKATDKYIDASATLSSTPQDFMLLRKEGYDYGVFAKTGAQTYMLSFGPVNTTHTLSIAEADPNKFIPFALSTHRLIYHLVINTSNQHTIIPHRTGDETTYTTSSTLAATDTLMIKGTTQRDLTSVNAGEGVVHYAGEKYQLGHTYMGQTYCVDAGQVSIGDELVVPNEFSRPNCVYFYYVDNIQTKGATGTYQKSADDNSAYETERNGLSLTGYYYFRIGTSTYTYKRVHVTATSPLTYTEVACTKDDWDNCWQDDPGLNNRFKGLKVTKLMSASELVGSVVKVNVAYGFNAGLETNAGDGFVTKMNPAGTHYLWYTFETSDATPQLAHYTHVRGMRAESGRALHYTNDYLWSPLGDPYGFKSYNRYVYKNNNEDDKVLTSATLENNAPIVMDEPGDGEPVRCPSGNEIYELLESTTPGSGNFRVHPLLNTDNTLFLSIKETGDAADIGKLILSNATPVKEWTYGLGTELLNPYYQGAGNVGGLNATGKTAYETAQTTYAEDQDLFKFITDLQKICYNNTNIVPYSAGYYRLCNQPGASSLSTQRYASGYLHDIEKTAGESSTAIPMHFYSKKGVNGTFNGDTNPLKAGFTSTDATRGDIPVPATEYDPSTIFQFTGEAIAAKMQTQDLYVIGAETDENSGYAKMTSNLEDATSFHVDDIGGAVVIIYNLDGSSKRHYINYKQGDAEHIYDLHYYENVDVDGSKWCMVPADTMVIATNQGGDGYYYATFYAPFDVLLPENVVEKGITTKSYYAYTCDTWNDNNLHPKKVPAVTGSPAYAEGKFVPAGIPVIIRTTDESNSVTLALPSTSRTASSITTAFMGTYLEQLLSLDTSHDAYTFGLPFASDASIDRSTGVVTAPLKESATTGVGFYINANPNKEYNALQAMWQRNNRYVIHNKIYYRASGGGGSGAPAMSPQFVPVIFDDLEEQDEELNPNGAREIVGDGCIYDLMGRKVATREQVEDGSWKQRVATGIYILNGKKFQKK